jgi:putative copper resistance protein D
VIFAGAPAFPQASPIVSFFIPVVKDLNLFAGIALIGLLLTAGFFLREEHGVLTTEGIRIKTLAGLAALVWFVTTLGSLFLELANLFAESVVSTFQLGPLGSYIGQTSQGKTYLSTLLAGAIVLAMVRRIKKTGGVVIALAITFIGFLAPVFQSHSSSSSNHGLAIGGLLFHVLFISLWVGGVLGLIAIKPNERALAIPRFSSLAFWCAIIVTVSGLVTAWTRLNFWAAFTSLYALLVLLKVILTAILIYFGVRHRRHIAAHAEKSLAVFQLLTAEIMVMAMTVAIGGWLSTTQPPIAAKQIEPSDALILTGINMPAQPNLSRLFWMYIPDGLFLGLLIIATALYIRGVVVMSRRGDKWPVGRTVSFIIAVAVTDYATSGGLGIYAHFAFSFHMVAHMVLGMIAPIAFVLSAPITLALRTLPQGRGDGERGIRGLLLSFLHSRYSQVVTNPVVALAIFDGSLFALYMTPLFGHLMQSHSGHFFMNLHFLLAGILFFHVIVGIDPNPRKVPHIVRIIILFAAMSIHALFSIALMSNSVLIDGGFYQSLHRPWLTDLLNDQHTGGAVGWAMGEIPILIALVATFIQWTRDDARETRRLDRAAARAEAMGEDDELAKYNKYLAQLNRQSDEKSE